MTAPELQEHFMANHFKGGYMALFAKLPALDCDASVRPFVEASMEADGHVFVGRDGIDEVKPSANGEQVAVGFDEVAKLQELLGGVLLREKVMPKADVDSLAATHAVVAVVATRFPKTLDIAPEIDGVPAFFMDAAHNWLKHSRGATQRDKAVNMAGRFGHGIAMMILAGRLEALDASRSIVWMNQIHNAAITSREPYIRLTGDALPPFIIKSLVRARSAA